MIKIKKNYKKLLLNLFIIFALFNLSDKVFAASTPTLTLTNNSSTIGISVTGADGFASVLFKYPTDSTYSTYASIDIGQTNANGSFNVSVGPSSYGLNYGYPVYVSVDGVESSHVSWPSSTSNTQTTQTSGSLVLSRQSVTLAIGQNVNVFANNSANALTINGNSNSSVASASLIQGNMVFVNAMNVGSTVITICASTDGCNNVTVTVQSSSQSVSFSQSVAYLTVGQQPLTLSIYGPGDYYGLKNSNDGVITATTSGSNLTIYGYAVGQSVVSLCATGWQCGSLTVNVLPSGSTIPTATVLPATDYTNIPPQISSLNFSSNNVQGAFFGAATTLSLNFKSNESVTNVQVKISGSQVAVGDAGNGSYGASYTFTGNETLPLPVVISFTNSNGQVGQFYYWLGNSSANLTSNTSNTQTTSNAVSSSQNIFTKYLYMGMTKLGISDSEVTELQKYLKNKGFFTASVTGYFGSVTKSAVQAYQKNHNLNQLGAVGPSTRELLNQGK